jgi:hypothetical protein
VEGDVKFMKHFKEGERYRSLRTSVKDTNVAESADNHSDVSENSGSQGGEYEDGCLLGCCVV